MKPLIIIILSYVLFLHSAIGQINTDSIFESSINSSKLKEYTQAIAQAKQVLKIHPTRADVMIHIANNYSWQSKFDSAKVYIDKAYILNPKNNDLYNSWLNILLWNKEYNELLKVSDIALSNGYDNKENIAKKKLIAYKETMDYDQGIEYAKTLSPQILDTANIKAIYNEIYKLSKPKQITAFYSLDFFDNNDPKTQHLAFLDYSFKMKRNTLILRANYAHRFDKDDYMFEADYYYRLKKGRYFYFNYGIGVNHELFPKHSVGIEYYFPIVKTVSASLGGRYLGFKNSDVFIATGHIEKYINNSWLSFRPYYVFKNSENENSFSFVANYRLYLKNPINYWGIELGYGNSPDDRYIINSEKIFKLDSYRIKFERNIMLSLSNELRLSAGYSYEEYISNEFRNRYLIEIIFKHRF